MIALALALGLQDGLDGLVQRLGAPEPAERERATQQLLARPEWRDGLERAAAETPSDEVRERLRFILREWDRSTVRGRLRESITFLPPMPDEMFERWMDALLSDEPDSVLRALAFLGGESMDWLLPEPPSPEEEGCCSYYLSVEEKTVLLEAVHERLPRTEPWAPVREVLLGNASDVPAERIAPFVRACLSDGSPSVRVTACASALGLVPDAVEDLVERLGDPSPDVRLAATMALYAAGQGAREAAPELLDVLQDEEETLDVRCMAAWALGTIGAPEPEAMPVLLAWMRDPTHTRRFQAVEIAVRLGAQPDELLPVIREGLRSTDFEVRLRAHGAAQRLGPSAEPLVPDLVDILTDPGQGSPSGPLSTRYLTAQVLGAIGPGARDAVPALAKLATSAGTNDQLRQQIAWAFSQIGADAREALPVLREMAESPDSFVAQHARAAIAKIEAERR